MLESAKKPADGMTPDLLPSQIEAYRRMTFQDKIRHFGNLRRQALKLKAVGVRLRHSDWSESEVDDEVRRIFAQSGNP